MFEAKLPEAAILKRLLEAITDVTIVSFGCSQEGIDLLGTDRSDVALVHVQLDAVGFKSFLYNGPMQLDINLANLIKLLKFAEDGDECTLKVADNVLKLIYEGNNSDRITKCDMELMDTNSMNFGIPAISYDACVIMPSSEFTRLVHNLSQLSESVQIEVNRDGVCFTSGGGQANASVLLKETEHVPGSCRGGKGEVAKEDYVPRKVQRGEMDDEPIGGVTIQVYRDVTLTLTLKYLVNFSKGESLSDTVELMMNNDEPMLISYPFEHGRIRYYLAPMIGEY